MNDETKKGTSPVRRLRANRTPRNRGAGMVFVQQASTFPNDQRAHSQGAERGDRAMDRGDECTKLLRKLARIDVDGQSAEHVANLAIQYAAEARRLHAPARPTAAREETARLEDMLPSEIAVRLGQTLEGYPASEQHTKCSLLITELRKELERYEESRPMTEHEQRMIDAGLARLRDARSKEDKT